MKGGKILGNRNYKNKGSMLNNNKEAQVKRAFLVITLQNDIRS